MDHRSSCVEKIFHRRLQLFWWRLWFVGTIILATAGSPPLFAEGKDSLVILRNGDKITGEVKKLSKGVLYFKADYMTDAVQIDWTRVERLATGGDYNILLTNGERLAGKIDQGSPSVLGGPDFTIVNARTSLSVRRQQILELLPVEDTFWHQLTGSVDYGFGFTGGNDYVAQSSLSASAAYRTTRSFTQLDGSSVFNAQSGAKNSGRNTLDFEYAKAVNARWYAGALVDLLSSEQQDLTFRGSFGGGTGRDLIRERTTSFQVFGGAVLTRESYFASLGPNPQENNAEGFIRLGFETHTFKTMRIDAQATVFPSISTPGRFRFGAQSSLMFEIVHNLYWKFSVYENYDTRPPVAAPRNDFGTSTSFGWKF
jgi:hypothetical protein